MLGLTPTAGVEGQGQGQRCCPLTDKAEDVSDGGHEDDQSIGAGQQNHCDDGVTDPAELLGGTQQLVDRGADLERVQDHISKDSKAELWQGSKERVF